MIDNLFLGYTFEDKSIKEEKEKIVKDLELLKNVNGINLLFYEHYKHYIISLLKNYEGCKNNKHYIHYIFPKKLSKMLNIQTNDAIILLSNKEQDICNSYLEQTTKRIFKDIREIEIKNKLQEKSLDSLKDALELFKTIKGINLTFYEQYKNFILTRTTSFDKYKTVKHHVFPKGIAKKIGFTNDNVIINLTHREHLICHEILYNMFKNTEFKSFKITNLEPKLYQEKSEIKSFLDTLRFYEKKSKRKFNKKSF